jgi:lipopolysaccharide export system permease protein
VFWRFLSMLGISRYIFGQLAAGLALVSAALMCVMWLTQSLRFIELIVNKGLSLGRFTQLTMLLMPSFLIIIIPISLFAVTLFTYNKLNMDRELVVMRAAGLSHWMLSQPALILSGLALAFSLFLSLWFIPWTVRSFHEMQWSIRNDFSNILLQEGTFNKFGDGVTIYVGSRSPAGEMVGLLVHDRRNIDRPVTLMAERGALIQTDQGPRVLMVNGNRQQVTRGTGKLSLLYFDQYTLDFDQGGAEQSDRTRDAREMTLDELYRVHKDSSSLSEYRKAKVEIHQRFSAPLYDLGLPLIALACLLPAGFNRRGQTATLGLSIILMVLSEAASLAASNLATADLLFVPLMYLSAMVPIMGGVMVLREFNWSRFRPAAVAAPP